ncbi:hypothetical protein L7F22_009669 [Adiantum nelumboides]|nr:hypothetical protein [Adiantum nelumboides]
MPVVLGAASAFTSRRLALYGLASTIAAIAITFNAFRQRPNFYSATVMLGGSNGCMMVLINFGLFLALCFGKICQKIFFGPLRAVEVEHLHERLWYAITETLLAMTIFRDDFDSSFAILFGTLLFLKVFHWLSADRVEYMEQSPSVGRLFHVRMITILSMLFEFDLFLATFAVEVLIIDKDRKGIMIMFANEFFILGATLWSTICKYLINCQDMRSEEPWEAKSMYVFFVDLITDFLKLATYIACFCLILSYYGGLPLHIFRDVYVTGLSFFSRLRDFIKYRAATRNMDTRFPNATQADLRSMSDGTCIICREEMIVEEVGGNDQGEALAEGRQPTPTVPASSNSGLNETPKKLPCGHIFHFHCLRSWLERQQSCPTCRRTVFATSTEAERDPLQGQGGQPRQEAAPVPLQAHAPAAANNTSNNNTPTNGSRQDQQQRTQSTNADNTVRDRLQSFLQKIQTDAQRIRQEHQQSQQNAGRQSAQSPNSSATSGRDAPQSSVRASNETERTSSPARKMLINSLFASNSDPLAQLSRTGRRENGEARSSGSVLPPPPILRGLNESSSSRHDSQSDTYIPPAPWTLRSDGRNGARIPRPSSSLSQGAETSSQAVVSSTAPHERAEGSTSTSAQPDDEVKGKEAAAGDPVDAREAARAAALRRFQKIQQEQPSASQSMKQHNAGFKFNAESDGTSKEGDSKATEKKVRKNERTTPGNPHLIPLFDPSRVQGYAEHHAANLPYPIIENSGTRNHFSTGGLNRIHPESLNLESLSLSDEELNNLSKETREGLQERLRLLYRVEGTISNLVEEITRALSVMPNEKELVVAEDVNKSESPPQGGKGKAPAEGIHASAFE